MLFVSCAINNRCYLAASVQQTLSRSGHVRVRLRESELRFTIKTQDSIILNVSIVFFRSDFFSNVIV